ncbi:hypothetical protein BGY98DRAFT_117781 [Russula aff. rugulosa BPL654]|nr:hypothetical protein BGY98DRAFT_117781 [Russula aff. rugulosa BPL654]
MCGVCGDAFHAAMNRDPIDEGSPCERESVWLMSDTNRCRDDYAEPASPLPFPTTCTIFPLKYTYVITPFPPSICPSTLPFANCRGGFST